jgi:hypothetical protein
MFVIVNIHIYVYMYSECDYVQRHNFIILHTLVSNIIQINSFDGLGDLSLIVGNNITGASHDLIIIIGNNIMSHL